MITTEDEHHPEKMPKHQSKNRHLDLPPSAKKWTKPPRPIYNMYKQLTSEYKQAQTNRRKAASKHKSKPYHGKTGPHSHVPDLDGKLATSDKPDIGDCSPDGQEDPAGADTPNAPHTLPAILSSNSGILVGIYGITPYLLADELGPWARPLGLGMVGLGTFAWWMGNRFCMAFRIKFKKLDSDFWKGGGQAIAWPRMKSAAFCACSSRYNQFAISLQSVYPALEISCASASRSGRTTRCA